MIWTRESDKKTKMDTHRNERNKTRMRDTPKKTTCGCKETA